MINLAIFCPECTPWLVLMLLGAWILGWFFWSMIKGTKYRASINELESQTADLKKKIQIFIPTSLMKSIIWKNAMGSMINSIRNTRIFI